jgi:hypothetical protein
MIEHLRIQQCTATLQPGIVGETVPGQQHCAAVKTLVQLQGMQVTYELTQRDFFESLIAHRDRNPIRKWLFRVVVSVGCVFTCIAFVLLFVDSSKQAISSLVPLLALGPIFLLLFWGRPWLAARTQFRKQPSAHGPRTVRLDDAAIHSQWDGGTSDVQWETFMRALESKTQFLLYPSPAYFFKVPKRALTPEQLAEFRALLALKIPSSKR